MIYAQMIDLIEQAKQRGAEEEYVNSVLRDHFDQWLASLELGELTEEEEEALWLAFQEGFGVA